jgi:4-hydroxy-2-oxoheptanedioate aldolase
MQHGVIDYQAAVGILQAINTTEMVPFVRVPWNEQGIIGKMLDAGAMGVIIPMVNTVAEAKAAVASCRYFPQGARSFGPTRVGVHAGRDYYSRANEEIACIPMIETQEALDNLDDILSVPGIDAVYVGPADLSITLGLPPSADNDAPIFNDALKKIVDACKKHGVTPGIHASAALARKRRETGFQLITVGSDMGGMVMGANADLARVREDGGKPGDPNKIY